MNIGNSINMLNQKCKLCGYDKYDIVYQSTPQLINNKEYRITDLEKKPSFKIVKCQECNLVYALDHPDEKEIVSSYEKMQDDLYLQEEKGRRISSKALLRKIQSFKKYGKLLDIGCTTGFLLDEARKMGYKVEGLEISSWAVNFAKEKLNLSVHKGSISEISLPHNHFDIIIMNDVIEHLLDPLGILIKIRQILKPKGLLCITTPCIDSVLSRLLKAKWWGIKDYHLVYFSKKTMQMMLDKAGFKIMKVSSYSRTFSINYWVNRLGFYITPLNKVFKILKWIFNPNFLITINSYDQLVFFIRKKRSLEFIEQDENIPFAVNQNKLKTIVVLPAYHAAKTLARTLNDIPKDCVDDVILVDDCSKDDTVNIAKSLGLNNVFRHETNKGYGANQKTCYKKALELGADIIVMVHPDYQYDPKVIPELIKPIKEGRAGAVFGSRMMKDGALEGGMPLWKHNANILLTALENVILKTYLTEYHSGFRAYSAEALRSIQFEKNNNGFIFDTEIIVQILLHNFKIEEIPIRTRYFDEASTIKFWPSVIYGLGILKTLFKYILQENNIIRFKQFE